MTAIDGFGYFAASLVLATFCTRTMVSLRSLAIASNLAFITYALSAHLMPILLLHTVMLPLNIRRLREARACAADETATAAGQPSSPSAATL
jgi:CRP/FNR family cyclic AMP-dependent transcriptional regulator